MENLPFFMECSDWISNPSMIYCRDSNLIISKGQLMFGKSSLNLFPETKNRKHRIRYESMRSA